MSVHQVSLHAHVFYSVTPSYRMPVSEASMHDQGQKRQLFFILEITAGWQSALSCNWPYMYPECPAQNNYILSRVFKDHTAFAVFTEQKVCFHFFYILSVVLPHTSMSLHTVVPHSQTTPIALPYLYFVCTPSSPPADIHPLPIPGSFSECNTRCI